ncbi:MAG TPA: energy-coupling factor transporter transmembrane component T [Candidatus Subteraquimicrobiales bacterium]
MIKFLFMPTVNYLGERESVKILSNITIGQYYSASSQVHSLDPRAKIVLVILLMAATFAIQNFFGFLTLSFILLSIVALASLPFSWVLRSVKPLLYIIIFSFIVHILFTGGEPLVKIGIINITREGVRNGFFITLRLVLLVSGTSILIFTTTPIELTDGLEYLLKPLSKLKVPTHELAMMLTIALRFIPTLLLETERLMKAQMARGADFESGNFLRRAKCFLPLIIPLFISAFRRADELALAMESRCYRGGQGRSRLRTLKMRGADWFNTSVVILLLVGVVAIGRL